MRMKGAKEITEVIRGHRESEIEKKFSLLINQGCMEGIFRDIDIAEKSKHEFTSNDIILSKAGEAFRSILYSNEGSITQSAYKDIGRQETDSFEGCKAREKWRSLVSSHLSYRAYHHINNFNYL